MLTLLCHGKLIRDPQRRQSANGKPYATALVSVPCDGAEAVLVSCIGFGAIAERLLQHQRDDTVVLLGKAKLSSWEGKDGATKTGLSLTVDKLLSVYELSKRQADLAEKPRQPVTAGEFDASASSFNDEIPF